MQKEIKGFVADIKKEIRKSFYRNKITSIVLLGSAARGEWIRGESDVDIIIVVKNNKCKQPVTKWFSKILDKLNKKHKLKLEETASDKKKYDNVIVEAVMMIETSTLMGVPFYVVSYEDYDFVKNKVKDPRIWFLATFLGSLSSFLVSVKNTGKTIYGKDLLKLIDIKLGFFEKFKVNLGQGFFILSALLILPFDSKLALKHAMKATLHEEETDLIFLGKHIKGYFKDKKLFNRIFKGSDFLKSHLKKTLYYRLNYKKLRFSRSQTTDYILDTIKFLAEINKELDKVLSRS